MNFVFVRIEKPKWMAAQRVPLFTPEKELEYASRSVNALFAPEGKKFPIVSITLTHSTYHDPVVGKTLNFSISHKMSKNSWWESCQLPSSLFKEFAKLYEEALAKEP